MEDKNVKVRVSNLCKQFGDLKVLDNISFDVLEGEFLCVVGPTGCGKTTFLNSVTKLYEPTSGEILVNGKPVDLQKNNISYIFQEQSTMEWYTVEQNIEYGLRIKGVPKQARREVVDEVLETGGLADYRTYYPRELSASMVQRGVIGRAFATKPELLLMDAPYGQLDIELRFKLEDELLSLWRKTGTTVIFITHNIEEAVYLSEHILVLTNKPSTIKKRITNSLPRPRNVIDAEFIALRNEVTELIKWW